MRQSCTERFEVDTSISSVNRIAEGRIHFVKAQLEETYTLRFGAGAYEQFPDEQIREGIAVNVFFSTISQTVMELEEKIPVFDLISNVGGQLGKSI